MIGALDVSPTIARVAARTPTLAPATHTNSYALGAREVVLVEPATPYADEQREWIAWARALASSGRRLVAIVATHHHPDHVGGVEVLARELGLPVWAHEETAARVPETAVARRLADGDEIVLAGPTDEKWRVLHTPGHAPGHVCLFEERSRAVVVGDMVASVGTILIAPGEGDMAEYVAQLARLARLDAKVALPAHGDPIDAPTAHFEHYIAHRGMRENKVIRALEALGAVDTRHGATLADVLARAYDDTPLAMMPFAALSLEAHLVKLAKEGRARREEQRWYVVRSAP